MWISILGVFLWCICDFYYSIQWPRHDWDFFVHLTPPLESLWTSLNLVNHLRNPGNGEVTYHLQSCAHPSIHLTIHPSIQPLANFQASKEERGEVPNVYRMFHAYFFIRVSSFPYGMSAPVLRDLDRGGCFSFIAS